MKTLTILCSLLVLLTVVCSLPLTPVSANSSIQTISFSSPAIGADVGNTVNLSSYAVEFKSGVSTAADKITWSSSDTTITNGSVKPTASGVYKLTATADGKSKTVYLVVKAPSDTEYVLYYDDFSADTLSNYRAVQQTSGAKISVSDGKLVLNANNAGDSYIRLLLPDWLGDFGNYSLTTSFTITASTANSRWLSLMGRIQNDNSPYWQAAVRQNAKASNGTEIAERTSANKWNVTHSGPYTSNISASQYYELNFTLTGNTAATAINGERLLFSDGMTYAVGDIGLQVRGLSASFDYIKVTLTHEDVKGEANALNTVRDPSSNIILTPAIVSYIDSIAALADIQTNSPAAAIMYVNSALEITNADGVKISTVEDALQKLDKKIIPAFYIKDRDTVTVLSPYLKKQGLVDIYFISSDAALLKTARTTYQSSFGILDCSDRTVNSDADLLAMRDQANSSYAKVILLPESALCYKNVNYLQTLFMTVWTKTSDTTAGYLKAITAGVNGIVCTDRARLEEMFTKCFAPNTMIRPINIIGHRGVPSLAQENTIAGSVLAYEKGANMIEMDIYLSADNQIVVMHDSTLDRTTNGTGNTESFTVAQLQKFSVDANSNVPAEPIPTLEDYFKEFKGKDVKLIIEIKSGANKNISARLKDLIAKYDIADQVNVITFSEDHMKSMRLHLPEISVGYLSSAVILNENDALASLENIIKKIQPVGTTYNPSYAKATLGPNLIRAASYRGITLWPYTINNSEDFSNYILYGTNGITTNNSQYVTNYIKRLTAPASEIITTADGVDFELTQTTYARVDSQTTRAEMVIVDDCGLYVTYADGKLSATGRGEALVYFRVSTTIAGGKRYYVCSEPVIVKSKVSDDITTPADTEPVVTPPIDTTPADTSTPVKNEGCGAVMSLGIMACILPAALIFKKKKHSK